MARLSPAPGVPRPERPEAPGGHTGLESVEVPAGPCEIGAPDGRFAYDNERPRHRVELPAFRIGRTPITNATFLSFVEGGGYKRRPWWSHEAWAWKEEYDITHPEGWATGPRVGVAGRSTVGRRSTRTSPWSTSPGSRPTPSPARTGLGCPPSSSGRRRRPGTREAATRQPRPGLLGPAPVGAYPEAAAGCGALGMLGDVWEWTSAAFRGYPGFVAHPYREYSEVFFGDDYRVLRGGSWATRSRVASADASATGTCRTGGRSSRE